MLPSWIFYVEQGSLCTIMLSIMLSWSGGLLLQVLTRLKPLWRG